MPVEAFRGNPSPRSGASLGSELLVREIEGDAAMVLAGLSALRGRLRARSGELGVAELPVAEALSRIDAALAAAVRELYAAEARSADAGGASEAGEGA